MVFENGIRNTHTLHNIFQYYEDRLIPIYTLFLFFLFLYALLPCLFDVKLICVFTLTLILEEG